jgi:c-di-GMP-binding flagellar brake protein YcgR
MSEPERRRADRLKTLMDVAVTFRSQNENKPDANMMATCLDVSETGMVFSCEGRPRLGAPVTVAFSLPGGQRFRAHATVVRCEPIPNKGRFRIGVRFADLLEDTREKLADFLMGEKRQRWGG